MREATERAIELLGGIRPAARILDLDAGSVHYWKRRGRVPAENILALEAALHERVGKWRCTREGVTRYTLRPDVYGKA